MKIKAKISLLFVFLTAVLLCLGAQTATADEQGAFRADDFQGGAMGMEFLPVTIEEAGRTVSIWPNCTVTDFVLDEVVAEGDHAITKTVYTQKELASNQVINLTVQMGEVLPRFRITAVNEKGQRERWYISESGEEGAIVLLPSESVESAFPVECNGLFATEESSRALLAFLEEEHPGEELIDAANKLYHLWEEEWILVWGGYAMSYAEQDWIAAHQERMEATAGETQRLIAGATDLRQHVYQLFGEDLPSLE